LINLFQPLEATTSATFVCQMGVIDCDWPKKAIDTLFNIIRFLLKAFS
jgi:hypothetical protein